MCLSWALINNFCYNNFHFGMIQGNFAWLFYYWLKLYLNLSHVILKPGYQKCPLSYLDLCIGSPVVLLSTIFQMTLWNDVMFTGQNPKLKCVLCYKQPIIPIFIVYIFSHSCSQIPSPSPPPLPQPSTTENWTSQRELPLQTLDDQLCPSLFSK